MASIENLLSELDERIIAQRIGIPHDEARMRYHLNSNTVRSFDEFTEAIGRYYNYQFTTCVSNGGNLAASEAAGRAKEMIKSEYRRKGDIEAAYNDAHAGTNGGMRMVFDIIAEGLKAESVERYIRDVFDRHVTPNSWEQKVEIIRLFIDRYGAHLSSSISSDQPERYADRYEELIRSYVEALKQTSAIFRSV